MSASESNESQRSNSSPEEFAQSVAMVQAALDDMKAGDTGRPVADVLRGIREKHGLTVK